MISSLSESTGAFYSFSLKCGFDFFRDPNGQGTPGASLRCEMPFDKLDVSSLAVDAEWCPCPLGYLYAGCTLSLAFELKRLAGSWCAVPV